LFAVKGKAEGDRLRPHFASLFCMHIARGCKNFRSWHCTSLTVFIKWTLAPAEQVAAIYYCLEMIKTKENTLYTNQSDKIMNLFLCIMTPLTTKINVLYIEIQFLQCSEHNLLPLQKTVDDVLILRITWNTRRHFVDKIRIVCC